MRTLSPALIVLTLTCCTDSQEPKLLAEVQQIRSEIRDLRTELSQWRQFGQTRTSRAPDRARCGSTSVRRPKRREPDTLADGVSRVSANQFSATQRIDFDHDPSGQPITRGTNLENLYENLGVRLRSANPNSYVAADGYVVQSKTRGLSAANKSPRWTADIFVEFTTPVTNAGLYVAAVSPGGTGIVAFDKNDRPLARIHTIKSGTDFLGIASPHQPIKRLRIFRVPSIDPNFTIDDLMFTPANRATSSQVSSR